MAKKLDIEVLNQGSILVFKPLTKIAKAWIKENVHLESWQMWAGGAFTVDHRCAENLIHGMRKAGLRGKVNAG